MAETFSVELVDAGDDGKRVAMLIRRLTGGGMGRAMAAVRATPSVAGSGLDRREAMRLVRALQGAGATARVRTEDVVVDRPVIDVPTWPKPIGRPHAGGGSGGSSEPVEPGTDDHPEERDDDRPADGRTERLRGIVLGPDGTGGIPEVTVTLRVRGSTDALATARTDDGGRFVVREFGSIVRERLGDERPPLTADLARDGVPIGASHKPFSWERFHERGEQYLFRVDAAEWPGRDPTPPEAEVFGSVTTADGRPAGDLTVRAFDRDLQSEQPLGIGLTDDDGGYAIGYDPETATDAEAGTADLVVAAFDAADGELGRSETVFNATGRTGIDLVLPEGAPVETSEYDRLRAELVPVLDGATVADLTDDQLRFLAGELALGDRTDEFPAGEETPRHLRSAERAASFFEVRPAATYGLSRGGLPHDHAELAAVDEGTLRSTLEAAVEDGVIGTVDVAATVAAIRRRRPAPGVETAVYRVSGAVRSDLDGAPLSDYRVALAVRDESGTAAEPTIATTDGGGRFALELDLPREDGGESSGGRPLSLRVAGPDGTDVEERTVTVPAGGSTTVEVRVAASTTPVDATALEAFVDRPDRAAEELAGAGIGTMADLRAAVAGIDEGGETERDQLLLSLRPLAALSTLDAAPGDYAALVAAGHESPTSIATTPLAEFVGNVDLDAGTARSIHAGATAQAAAIDAFAADLMGRVASTGGGPAGDGDLLRSAVLPELSEHCECDDCESALGPGAYLADLLDYVRSHVRQENGRGVDADFLSARYHQAFEDLPVDCEAAEETVRGARLAAETLLAHLGDDLSFLRDGTDAAIYRETAYETLLNHYGVGPEDVAEAAAGGTTGTVAERLSVEGDVLDDLLPADGGGIGAEAALEGIFGYPALVREDGGDVVRIDPLVDRPDPALDAWQFEGVHRQFEREDHPADPYVDGDRPVVDPDVVGPDDFRTPGVSSPAFATWERRRTWVDDHLAELAAHGDDLSAAFGRMADPVTYDGATHDGPWSTYGDPAGTSSARPWEGVTAPGGFEALVAALDGEDEGTREEARAVVTDRLGLSTDAFRRLAELATVHGRAAVDDRREGLDGDDLAEIRSILVAAHVRNMAEPWLAEETAEGVHVGPATFWRSVTDPAEGEWSPAVVEPGRLRAGRGPVVERMGDDRIPVIDPDFLAERDLPDPVAGRTARDLLGTRREELATKGEAIEAALWASAGAAAVDAMLDEAYGGPPSGGDWATYLETLEADLTSTDAATVDAALARIETELYLEGSEFEATVALRREVGQEGDGTPDESAVGAVVEALTAGWKYATAYDPSGWPADEAGLAYWELLKARLPPWRAPSRRRSEWLAAHDRAAARPVADPDVVDPRESADRAPDAPVVVALDDRRRAVETVRRDLRATLSAGGDEAAAFEAFLGAAFGVDREELARLAAAEEAGDDVERLLEQLPVTARGFGHLVEAHERLAAGDSITGDLDRLVAVGTESRKRRTFGAWNREERAFVDPATYDAPGTGSVLVAGPAWFDAGAVRERAERTGGSSGSGGSGTATTPSTLDREARREFERTVLARAGRIDSLREERREAVATAEEAALPDLRDRLIGAATEREPSTTTATLTDRYHLDFAADACSITTRVARAIETIQGLVEALRTGDDLPDVDLELTGHGEEGWRWLGSYATWKAAMAVFVYPENVLLPTLRRRSSPAFDELVADLRAGRIDHVEGADRYYRYLRDAFRLSVEAGCPVSFDGWQGQFVFGPADDAEPPAYYWTLVDEGGEESFPRELPFEDPGAVRELVGAVQHDSHVYVFARVWGGKRDELHYLRRNLRAPGEGWRPGTVGLPRRAGEFVTFDAAVKRPVGTDQPPHLLFQPDGDDDEGPIYHRYLIEKVTDPAWTEAYRKAPPDERSAIPERWEVLDGGRRGRGGTYYSDRWLGGLIEYTAATPSSPDGPVAAMGEAVLFAGHAGTLVYRILGENDDVVWRVCSPSQFYRGAFLAPDGERAVAVTSAGTSVVDPSGDRPTITDDPKRGLHELDGWLADTFGVSLRDHTLDDGRTTYFQEAQRMWSAEAEELASLLGDLVDDDDRWAFAERTLGRITKLYGTNSRPESVFDAVKWALMSRNASHGGVGVAVRPGADDEVDQEYGSGTYLVDLQAGPVVGDGIRVAFDGVAGGINYATTASLRLGNDGLAVSGARRLGLTDGTVPTDAGTERLSAAFGAPTAFDTGDLAEWRSVAAAAETTNDGPTATQRTLLEEASYFVPVAVGLALRREGDHETAVEWFRAVSDFRADDHPEVWFLTESRGTGYGRNADWLLDPIDPHGIARARDGTYARFTALVTVQSLLEGADAAYARDTAESVDRARTLYRTALEVLDAESLAPGSCPSVTIDVDEDLRVRYGPAVDDLRDRIAGIDEVPIRLELVDRVESILAESEVPDEGYRAALDVIEAATETPRTTLGSVDRNRDETYERIHRRVLADERGGATFDRMAAAARAATPAAVADGGVATATTTAGPVDFEPGYGVNYNDYAGWAGTSGWGGGRTHVATHSVSFCVPANPLLDGLRTHAETSLRKIRSCRNVAGLRRELEPYAASTDPTAGLPSIGADGTVVAGETDVQPTEYRYRTLMERARSLVSVARSVESDMLRLLEQRDEEAFRRLQADQQSETARAQIRLQDQRLDVAGERVDLARLQGERASFEAETYRRWIAEGLNRWEETTIEAYRAGGRARAQATELDALAANYRAMANAATGGLAAAAAMPFTIAAGIAGTASAFASVSAIDAETVARVASVRASHERRADEWKLRANLADRDRRIGAQQVSIAEESVEVVEQERRIAQLQADHADEVAAFLTTKFTGLELYDWMIEVVGGVYRAFLRQATALARLAEGQLAFERHEPRQGFISADYWTAGDARALLPGADGDGGAESDRRGLTGSVRLLEDLQQLDDYAFGTDERRLSVRKTVSLATLDPVAFRRLREDGEMTFATPMELFDRDHPGHYMRLIEGVEVAVVALTPPVDGIKASLTSSGLSRVVAGDGFRTRVVRGTPETIALSAPADDGLFHELRPDEEAGMLRPFEKTGVDTTWRFRMPRAANGFDYEGLADVLVTVEYSALESEDYRRRVIRELDDRTSAERAFSLRGEYPDQWFDLNNPETTDAPMSVAFDVRREQFPANLADVEIESVSLYAVGAGEDGIDPAELETTLSLTPPDGPPLSTTGTPNDRGVLRWSGPAGRSPVGTWGIDLPDTAAVREAVANDGIDDLLLVVTFGGTTPAWPEV